MSTPRRTGNRSRWMKLRDPDLLVAYMKHKDFTQARLARSAERSRQFIHMLTNGQKSTCQETVAKRIEEALDVPRGTLFLAMESPVKRPSDKRATTRRAA